jgi:L-2-hydroxyglutarate oxidase LhgO
MDQSTLVDIDVDVAVIGAGVVGLAVAAALAEAGKSVAVLERRDGPGRETSSRNSEVVHAGIYYPARSSRARLCVRGNRLLYRFCEQHNVAHRRLEKIIVATSEQEVGQLEQLQQRGEGNGAQGLRLLDRGEVRAMEPNVRAVAGLHSPTSGIVDSHGLMKVLEARIRAQGGVLAFHSDVQAVERTGSGYRIEVDNPSGRERLACRVLVNSAGLESDRVAAMAGVDGFRLHWCKGDYFAVSGRQAGLVSRLVYPVPAPSDVGLGIHVTLDLAGRMRLGPDTTYVERGPQTSLDVDPNKAEAFCRSVQTFLPDLVLEALAPDTAGLRPKLQGPGEAWQDFVIREESDQGLPGLVNLIGIDSPGLTASLAIGEEVLGLILASQVF